MTGGSFGVTGPSQDPMKQDPVLPPSSASGATTKKVNRYHLRSHRKMLEADVLQSSTAPSGPQEAAQACASRRLDRKRKWSPGPDSQPDHRKRLQTSATSVAVESKGEHHVGGERSDPIEHWVVHDCWPKSFAAQYPKMNRAAAIKRSDSSRSYAQSVKDGENPAAYTAEYEQTLQRAGIFMGHPSHQTTISDASKQLCNALQSGSYEPLQSSLFSGRFWNLLDRVSRKTEGRVERDLTPEICPSVERLFLLGNDDDFEHLGEEVRAMWTECTALAGPRPSPDLTVGIRESAFTDEEIQKLRYYRSASKPTLVRGDLYFPFLMCEVSSRYHAVCGLVLQVWLGQMRRGWSPGWRATECA